ncbi:dolichyl-phosphate-mannose--protein mannosyltransferase [Actinorugispora endophytica]|uniref:Polyprenol-phosphate-mannose--protein mannosyltransferase n=1 Tax=Actinorugispora endophytica TaxID=1605990 RepID=A0A4R6UFS3_9ACTN|nr:phospholipid carrier-dependent glycosyltransferase [Actinorugispora endophytica]TDQ45608.1 dolichyl-phosphate-mannose-protein mannosyltransferase [Actinorugispora endophytica]
MTTTVLPDEVPPAPSNRPSLRSRLVPAMPAPAWVGWVAALVVAAFAGALRFIRLGDPAQVYFDETYYAKDAFGLREYGAEHETLENADALLAQGLHEIFTGGGDFVVHPPLGKWLIAAGDSAWGLLPFGEVMTPTGWRLAAALFGTLSVLLLVRIALRMTRSVLLGASAGLIMALDGLHFTMSRIAMVDIFLTFLILAGFGCLVIDRDRTRARLAAATEAGLGTVNGVAVAWWETLSGVSARLARGADPAYGGDGPYEPSPKPWARVTARLAAAAADRLDTARSADRIAVRWLGVRWWRIAAGVCLGLACGTKWSALFFVAAFGLLTVAWDYGARRSVGQRRAGPRWLVVDAVPAFFQTVGVGAVFYLATWSGWLLGPNGWGRDWSLENPTALTAALPSPLRPVVDALRSLWEYHWQIWNFHSGLSADHDYASRPWEWIVMRTPVAFYYDGDTTECGASSCSSAILSLGTPAVWWLSIPACLVLLGWWVTYRDWRAGAVLLGVAAGWLPWFAYPDRTMFAFYALPMLPFLVLALVLTLGLLMGPDVDHRDFSLRSRIIGGVVYGVVLLLVIANFAYLYPVLSAEVIPYEEWADRMWFSTWIYGNGGPG